MKSRNSLLVFSLVVLVLSNALFWFSCYKVVENLSEDSEGKDLINLAAGFKNPPGESGIRCWWWWLNSNVTKESITKDLEAMHAKGFSGAMIFDAGTELWWGPDDPVPNGPMFSGPEWTELFMHALTEAQRLNLELGL